MSVETGAPMSGNSNMNKHNNYRVHWHVLLTHFPLSLYSTSFGFQILHFFAYPDCFELASTVSLIGATIMMVPTMVTGWQTWKKQYNAANVRLFQTKIVISFSMLAISLLLSLWRALHFVEFLIEPSGMRHWIFFFGIFLLMGGAIIEGYYGGRLSHK
jgi:uncharacterized membrane protein